jgi:hypothetical protein
MFIILVPVQNSARAGFFVCRAGFYSWTNDELCMVLKCQGSIGESKPIVVTNGTQNKQSSGHHSPDDL